MIVVLNVPLINMVTTMLGSLADLDANSKLNPQLADDAWGCRWDAD